MHDLNQLSAAGREFLEVIVTKWNCFHMDHGVEFDRASWEIRKRKSQDAEVGGGEEFISFSALDELNQDLLEKVLSWLPTPAFFRLTSVCKRWKSAAASPAFRIACSQIPSRDPWFFMVGDPPKFHLDRHPNFIVFDSAQRNWKQINYPHALLLLLQKNSKTSSLNIVPVAASGGLICFRGASEGELIVCNPLNGSCRHLPPPPPLHDHLPLRAIGMKHSSSESHNNSYYKLVLVFGDDLLLTNLSVLVYNSSTESWIEETMSNRKVGDNSLGPESNDDDAVYFLSKAGNVVAATNMQRSPSKQYSSVLITANAKYGLDQEEIIYFLCSSGKLVSCNLTRKCFYEYPRLLPVLSEYSIDVVECGGEMVVVVLSEFLESASLRVWRFDEDIKAWHQIAAMPPAMSHEWYGKKVDINCSGAGHWLLVCLNSNELCGYVLCDVMTNMWVELPACYANGEAKELVSAFSFEPRIEASV